VASVLRSYAIMPIAEYLRLLVALHTAERGWADAEATVPEVVCPCCSSTIRARMADGPVSTAPASALPVTCDRCVPGAHGERIDVSLPDQLPCHHLTVSAPYPPYPAVRLGP
jgi:hypothetical protein